MRQHLTEEEISAMSSDEMTKYIDEFTQELNLKNLNAKLAEANGIRPEAQDWKPDLSAEIDYMIPFPGLAQDIQRWILDTSIKPQPALAFASTISVLSVIYGRAFQVSGIKGNILSLCLAESGEGKDWPLKSCQKILGAIGMDNHVYGDMASGAALIDAIVETPNALLPIDEAGHYFASITSKNSNQYSREIMPIITKLYTSGADFYIDKKRKGQDSRKIIEPNLSVLAMSTERQIMESLKTSEVADGSLARFLVIFGQNNVPINKNRNLDTRLPGSIKSRVEVLKCSQFMLSSTNIELAEEYLFAKQVMEDSFNTRAIKVGERKDDRAMFKPFYYRLSVKSIQLALLIDQCYSIDVLDWCSNIVEKSCEVFIKKFLHLAADNDTERHIKIVQRAIKEAGKTGISKNNFYDKTRQVDPGLKKRILDDLLDSGKVFVEERYVGSSQKLSAFYYWRK